MTKIPTLFPIVSSHINLDDEEWMARLLPIEDPKDPTEGLFLYANKAEFNLESPSASLSKKVQTPLGLIVSDRGGFGSSSKRSGLAFLTNYVSNQKNGVMFRFDIFRDAIAESLLLLRLFSKGDVFVPYAIPRGFSSLRINADIEEVQKYYHLNQRDLPKFITFFRLYWPMLRTLDPYTKKASGNLAMWSKKIANALYLFNQSYFIKTDVVLRPEARTGNIDRLMALIMALDALFGITTDGNELARNTNLLLSKYYRNAKEEMQEFYDLRSAWVHANESTLNANITDRQIDTLQKFVQKACLTNIVLFNDENVRTRFEMSGKKHIIEYLALVPAKIDEAVEVVKGSGQRYDL